MSRQTEGPVQSLAEGEGHEKESTNSQKKPEGGSPQSQGGKQEKDAGSDKEMRVDKGWKVQFALAAGNAEELPVEPWGQKPDVSDLRVNRRRGKERKVEAILVKSLLLKEIEIVLELGRGVARRLLGCS